VTGYYCHFTIMQPPTVGPELDVYVVRSSEKKFGNRSQGGAVQFSRRTG